MQHIFQDRSTHHSLEMQMRFSEAFHIDYSIPLFKQFRVDSMSDETGVKEQAGRGRPGDRSVH